MAIDETERARRFRIVPARRSRGDLELELRCLVRVGRVFRRELRTRQRLAWTDRLRAWRLGFTSDGWRLYGLETNDPRAYVSEWQFARRGYKINGFLNPVVANKRILSQVLASAEIPHPPLLACVAKGRLVDLQGRLEGSTGERLAALLADAASLVFRPDWSGAGEGVFFVGRPAGAGGLAINGTPATRSEVEALVSGLDRYLVTPFVQQATYAEEIFPGVANTLRVLTLWDPETGPFVAGVVHRFATSRSFPIDNWHQGWGGLCASIDRPSGRLGRAVRLSAAGRLDWLSHHPENGRPIMGVPIPWLEAALAGILRAARCFPGAGCVGWDVVITDDGFRILEANAPPGLYVWQVHGPLLADERTARFFASHGFRVPSRAAERALDH